jgi:hypothetical protein
VGTAAAVLVALVAAAGGYLRKQNERHAPPTHVAATLPDLPNIKQLTADLRNAAPTRSSRPASTAGSVKLSRDLVQLTIVLPVGSEPGRYSVRLLRGAGEVVAAAAVDASIVNFATTLTATLDLRGVQPAPYALELQRAGEHADSYPVVVK